MTDACENITFARFATRAVMIRSQTLQFIWSVIGNVVPDALFTLGPNGPLGYKKPLLLDTGTIYIKTRMHSSRMRTDRALTVFPCPSWVRGGGGCLPSWGGGLPFLGRGGGLPSSGVVRTPPPP